MNKQKKKCVNCDFATYKAPKYYDVKDAKRGELCLYCTKHCKVIGERFVCDDWTAVKGDVWTK